MKRNEELKRLEQKIGYSFKDYKLIKQALVHSSYANENKMSKYKNNERLEFLGDAVLEIVVSDDLYRNNSKMLEGELTKKRASIVCEPTLATFAKEIKLGQYIMLGKGEENSGGRERASVLSDTVEAIIGAIYLDGGIEGARKFIIQEFLANLNHNKLFVDSKTYLQELIQKESEEPLIYSVEKESGPDHNKIFEVNVSHKRIVLGSGKGRSKKTAEQEAAFDAIHKIN